MTCRPCSRPAPAGLYDKQLQRFILVAETRPRDATNNFYLTQLMVAVSQQQGSALGPFNVYQTPINFPGALPFNRCPPPYGCFGAASAADQQHARLRTSSLWLLAAAASCRALVV